jgi:hypothetical protein
MKHIITILALAFILRGGYAQNEPRLVLPVGYLGGVTRIDSSPNDKLLITEDLNSDIILFDSDKLIELQRHNFGNCKITSSSFLNDSSTISICNDTLISVWNFYSDKVELYPISVQLSKLYVEEHGLYFIDKHEFVYKFNFYKKKINFKKIIQYLAQEIYFKSEKEIFLVNNKKLLLCANLEHGIKFKRKFDNEITALSFNSIGNVLIGFDNGEIIECDLTLDIIHKYRSISDRISTIGYINDSTIISGSYDYTVTIQNKKEILNSKLFDDWIIGMFLNNDEIITCTWNGMLNKTNMNLKIINEFQTSLKKATFFCQKGNLLFISYNDGMVNQFDVRNYELTNKYKISNNSIYGLDVSDNAKEIIIWDLEGVKIYDILEKKIILEFKRANISFASFIPNTSKYIFGSDYFLYSSKNDQTLDSISLINSWSSVKSNQNTILITGLNKLIEVDENELKTIDFNEVGQIWTSQKKSDFTYLLGSNNKIYHVGKNGKTNKIADFPMIIDGIEFIDSENIIVNCENGQLLKVDLKTKETIILADTKQEYGSWDFKVNVKTGKVIYPNAKNWDLKMDIDILDYNGKVLNRLENVNSEIVCISNSNKSIEFNQLDSNQVIFILTDGSVKLWDINLNGKDAITELGFDYFNILNRESNHYNLKGAFIKSGLLKLPIPGIDTLTFMNLKNGDWLVHDSKYRFDGTPGAIEKLYLTCGLEIIDLAQVKDSLWVPGLVEKIMNNEEILINDRPAPKLSDLNICDLTPVIEPLEDGDKGLFRYRIIPRNGGLGETEVHINGNLTYKFKPDQLEKKLEQKKEVYYLSFSSDTLQGFLTGDKGNENPILVKAKVKGSGIYGRGVVLDIEKETDKENPKFFGLFIGVNDYGNPNKEQSELRYRNLDFAAKDAKDLSEAVEGTARNLFKQDCYIFNLTGTGNAENIPTKANIQKALKEIGEKAKASDILYIFFAGHGDIPEGNGEKEIRFILHNADKRNLKTSSFGVDELSEWCHPKNIKAQKRVFVFDACHSGQIINQTMAFNGRGDDEATRIRQLDKLKDKNGMMILAASADDESAYEDETLNQGVLTYYLLQAIKEADDTTLIVRQWFDESIKGVIEYSRANGNKQEPNSFGDGRFEIGNVTEQVRSIIDISCPKTRIGLCEFMSLGSVEETYPTLKNELSNILKISSMRGDFVYSKNIEKAYRISGVFTLEKNKLIVQYDIKKDDKLIATIKLPVFKKNTTEKEIIETVSQSIQSEIERIDKRDEKCKQKNE